MEEETNEYQTWGAKCEYPMLSFEKEIFMDLNEKDALLIMAKGLTYHTILSNILWIHKDPSNLVLVLNSSDFEEKYFLRKFNLTPLPNLGTERKKAYLEGGIHFVSTRILVVDLLKNRVPITNITGMLVLRAHTVLESCQEAFALRLYRQKNKTGFIKAISNSPMSFTFGYHHVEKVMRALFVTELFLWPRFHGSVIKCMKRRQPEVVELHVTLTTNVEQIQISLIDIMNYTVKQLKSINKTLDLQEITTENCLTKKFHKILQTQLDCVWHQLSTRTKEYIQDLKILRTLIINLIHDDSVSFYAMVSKYRTPEYAHINSGWVLLDSAEQLFRLARGRVFNAKNECQNRRVHHNQVVKNIKKDPLMVKKTMFRMISTNIRIIFFIHYDTSHATMVVYEKTENLDLTQIELDKPVICIQTFKENGNHFSLEKTLEAMRPDYIVMYHSDVAAVRQIELFECRKESKEKSCKVYFIMHDGTVEEQAYLTSLKREKQAFELLISTKSNMVVPTYQDGKSDEYFNLNIEEPIDPIDTRKAGGQNQTKEKPVVIVDMREFRSDLPALLHKKGINIEPVTITIGDYILTPDICVERKSISDLIGSLNSGRLYTQCTQMCRNYSRPILLIEFDQNKPFNLQGHLVVSTDISGSSIQQKLQLLTIHFPRLKLVWSPNPYATAELFYELKQGRKNPNIDEALALSGDNTAEDMNYEIYNTIVHDFIQKLPGVTTKNISRILNRGVSLDHIIGLNKAELTDIVENKGEAETLFTILHMKAKPADTVKNEKLFGKRKFVGKNVNRNKKT
ncbi:hypothetical protein ACJJTC_009114 [Scirpophaga incertulas]